MIVTRSDRTSDNVWILKRWWRRSIHENQLKISRKRKVVIFTLKQRRMKSSPMNEILHFIAKTKYLQRKKSKERTNRRWSFISLSKIVFDFHLHQSIHLHRPISFLILWILSSLIYRHCLQSKRKRNFVFIFVVSISIDLTCSTLFTSGI